LIAGGENLAVSIRLKRMGRKRKPFYRVVVADVRTPRQGVAVDDLGFYNPMTDPAQIEIDEEKALAWLKEGAIPTDTTKSLLSKIGVLKKLQGQDDEPAEEEPVADESPEEENEEEPAEEQPDSESDDE
jgi:small subunit ribosomal protein S16